MYQLVNVLKQLALKRSRDLNNVKKICEAQFCKRHEEPTEVSNHHVRVLETTHSGRDMIDAFIETLENLVRTHLYLTVAISQQSMLLQCILKHV